MTNIAAKQQAKFERKIARLEGQIRQDQEANDSVNRIAMGRGQELSEAKKNESLLRSSFDRAEAARKDLLRLLHDKDDELANTNRLLVKSNAEVILWAQLAALRADTLAQMEVQLSQWQGHAQQ